MLSICVENFGLKILSEYKIKLAKTRALLLSVKKLGHWVDGWVVGWIFFSRCTKDFVEYLNHSTFKTNQAMNPLQNKCMSSLNEAR